MPVCASVHHGFVYGSDLSQFYEKLQENFDNADKILESV